MNNKEIILDGVTYELIPKKEVVIEIIPEPVVEEVRPIRRKLSEMTKGDRIFGISIYNEKISTTGNVCIEFTKYDKDKDWTKFGTFNQDTPHGLGCSSALRTTDMDKHCFLSEFTGKHFYFFTLKPEEWKNDFNESYKKMLEWKKKNLNKEIKDYKKRLSTILKNEI